MGCHPPDAVETSSRSWRSNVFRWLWDRSDRKQCYYEFHCLVCWIKLLLFVLKLRIRRSFGEKSRLLKVPDDD